MKKLRLTLLVKLTFLVVISLSDGLAGKFNLFSIYLSKSLCYFTIKKILLKPCNLSKWEVSIIAEEKDYLSGLIKKQVKSYLAHKSVY